MINILLAILSMVANCSDIEGEVDYNYNPLPVGKVSINYLEFEANMKAGFPVLLTVPWYPSMNTLSDSGYAHVDTRIEENEAVYHQTIPCNMYNPYDVANGTPAFSCGFYHRTNGYIDESENQNFLISESDMMALFIYGAYFLEYGGY